MLVLEPVRVVIEDAEDADETEVTIPFSAKNPEMGDHKIKFTPKEIYIDRSDFREVDSKDYFRLAPGKTVGLLNAPFPIKATSFTKDEATGKVTEIRAVFDKETKKPKAFIQWVGSDGRKVEVRIHQPLFLSENPAAAEGGYLNDLNPNSEIIYSDAFIESGIDEIRRRAPWPEAAGEDKLGKGGPESVRFQATRVAYFVRHLDVVHVLLLTDFRLLTRTRRTTGLFSTGLCLSRRTRKRASWLSLKTRVGQWSSVAFLMRANDSDIWTAALLELHVEIHLFILLPPLGVYIRFGPRPNVANSPPSSSQS